MKSLKIALSLFMVVVISLCSYVPVYAEPRTAVAVKETVMSTQLINKLNSARDTDIIEVIVWIKDVDDEAVEAEVKEKTGLKKDDIRDELGREKIKNYISEKRSSYTKKYTTSNTAFLNTAKRSNKSINIIFQSALSPMLILSGNKADISSIAKNNEVVSMDLFMDSLSEDCSIEANQNSFATYMRDTVGATGTYTANGNTAKIKIGQIESYTPDLNTYSSYFDTADCYSYGSSNTSADTKIHATLVAAIMVGKTYTYNGKTYKGIVPDAELHSYGISDRSRYDAVEKLVMSEADGGCGVDIINMSNVDIEILGEYTQLSQWLDHIAYKHDVHFVVAAGNKDNSPLNIIPQTGMAYNVITVGNFENENTTTGDRYTITSCAPSTLSDQLLNSNYFRMNDTSCYKTYNGQCKPDIAAEGTNIRYGAIKGTGTSFAAPQVAGIIAQLCSKYPSLLTKQSTVKAILAASSVYRISDDSYYSNTYLLNKQGSGVVNSCAAYAVLLGGKYMDITLPNTTQYYTTTITVPSSYTYLRVAMSWIKKNAASSENCDLSSVGSSNNYQPLANLKLEVFEGTGTSGTTVYTSDASNSNLELVKFDVYGGGTYTIRITNQSYNNSAITGSQYIALAWY